MRTSILALAASFFLAACDDGANNAPKAGPDKADTTAKADKAPAQAALKTGKGVDADKKVIRIGALNDETGPGAAIGKPFAHGKRLLAAQINAGGSGLLPDGWTVELVEKDHGYNPQNAVQAYNEIKGDVLFIGTSFGTPNTLPLRPMLEAEGLLAYPASLSSQMAEHAHTPPVGPSYVVEAQRAMDWVVANNADKGTIKAGIVYQQDDYGKDGLKGWKDAATQHGVEIVSEQTVAPGQKDFTAVVASLQKAGATHILLTTLPSATGPIVGTAAQMKFMPTWIGSTPAWIDAFYNPDVIPSVVFTNYYQANGLPFWGEPVTGMDAFTAAWGKHAEAIGASQDSYVMMSYIQGLVSVEAANRAIASGDLTREGYRAALTSMSGYDAGGMVQPMDFSKVPYTVSNQTRILKPDFEKKSWTIVADYAAPGASAEPAAPAAGAAEAAEPAEPAPAPVASGAE